jgi:SAM-dependent methyltransferase
MQTRHLNKEQYFNEQVYTTGKYVIPFIRDFITLGPAVSVLEIGCGEGGNLKPFLDMGCRVTGVDLSGTKIDLANRFYEDHPQRDRTTFIAKDIYLFEEEPPEKFDLIIMRDVIEHIHDQYRFMGFVKRFLKPGAVFFLGFPPWQNPFGGHQQICENKILSKLPYFHLFPVPIYRSILKAGGESKEKIEALLEIKATGIGIERFENILKRTDYETLLQKHFFLNPNYEIKFKLKPRKQLSIINGIPFFRNLVTTTSYYLLRKRINTSIDDGK